MSLDSLRDAASRAKKNEIANCALLRKRKLRELYAYTALLSGAIAPDPKTQDINLNFDSDPEPLEQKFLEENDIFQGRSFRDSTLPSPFQVEQKITTPPASSNADEPTTQLPVDSPTVGAPQDASVTENDLVASPNASNSAIQPDADNDTQVEVEEAPNDVPLLDAPSEEVGTPCPDSEDLSQEKVALVQTETEVAVDETAVQEPCIRPQPEDVKPSRQDTEVSTATAPLIVEQSNDKQASNEVYSIAPERQDTPSQKAPHERDPPAQDERREERKDDDRLALPTTNNAAELASSPSSTVGPYSTNTPHPNTHSPDTSPDEESFSADAALVRPSNVGQVPSEPAQQDVENEASEWPSKAAVRVPHESTPETPDAQLRMEDEQAIRSAQHSQSALREEHTRETQDTEESVPSPTRPSSDDSSQGTESEATKNESSVPTSAHPLPNSEQSIKGEISEDTKLDDAPIQKHVQPIPNDRQPTPPPEIDMKDAPELPVPDRAEIANKPSEGGAPRIPSPSSNPPGNKLRENTPLPPLPATSSKVSETVLLNEGHLPNGTLTPVSGALSAPDLIHRRSPRKETAKKKLSKVIFDDRNASSHSSALQLYSEDYAALRGASTDEKKDYLLSLFTQQAYQPPRCAPLQDLLHSANKTLSTTSYTAFYREHQDNSILKRIYNLQNANRWPLRQLEKAAEPPRPPTFLDHMLASMKWMSTDFREERKWKRATAKMLAELCAEYVNGTPSLRLSLRVKAVIPPREPASMRNVSIDRDEMTDAPTPDLVHSVCNETESDIMDEYDLVDDPQLVTPAEVFTYGYDDVIIKIDHTPATEGLLLELPTYDPREKRPPSRPSSAPSPEPAVDPYIVETSRFVKGKLQTLSVGPPRKRSRYEYEQEDDALASPGKRHSPERSIPSTPGGRRLHRNDLPAEQNDCALFKPENKHVRDRLHAGHAFRPPSEFPMPSTSFFESRSSSQWLWEEDQKLRTLVKEYAFNWSLVSDQLSFPSMYTAGAERRTPWECFERWVNLEGLPADMSKTQYFRTYQSRLEAAQRTISTQHQAAQQQLSQQGQPTSQVLSTPIRRRTAQPFRVERRRANRHLALIDAMRKLARKRESAAHKQQEAAKAAALRKAHEAPATNKAVRTPQEYSKLRYEQDLKYGVENDMYRRQMMVRQHALAARAHAQGIPTPGGAARGAGPTSNAQTNGVATSHPQNSNQASAMPMQSRSHPGQPVMQGGMTNGNIQGLSMGMQGIPRAQMQVNQPINPQHARLLHQQAILNRQQFLQQQQQQQLSQPGNLAAAHLAGTNLAMQSQHLMAQMGVTKMNTAANTSMNGIPSTSGSPQMTQASPSHGPQARPLSSGHVPAIAQIQTRIQQQHPEWTPEQVNDMAKRELHLRITQQQQRQSALNAAAGNVYSQNGAMMGNAGSANTQLYPPQYRPNMMQRPSPQQQQQQAGSPSMATATTARPPSRSATPQNPHQQGQQQQQQQAQVQQHSQSPTVGQAQVTRN